MLKVEFAELAVTDDALYQYAVIVSRMNGQWVFCRHKVRNTWEIPGGHREPDEPILDTARRELYEETGATDFTLYPMCAYSVTRDKPTYGLLCYAEIRQLEPLPDLEIAEIRLFDALPEALTYPQIQPYLQEKVVSLLDEGRLVEEIV